MGRFDGILMISDYDNTLRYTSCALDEGTPPPPVPERNIRAIRRFMAEGGSFAVATGRSLAAFHEHAETVPTNVPSIVDNGASIYDFTRREYLIKTALPRYAMDYIVEVLDRFPDISTEIYIPGDKILTFRPTDWMELHSRLTGAKYTVLRELRADMVTEPIFKALFVGEHSRLEEVRAYMEAKGWNKGLELMYTRDNLFEMTAPGADKAQAGRRLQELCGCHALVAIGDGTNDVSMLLEADRAFCPANAEPEVLATGVTVVCDCREGSVGDAIEHMEQELG